MKRSVVVLFVMLISVLASAQSRKEWLEYADGSFKNGDYASAAYFYQKVISKGLAGSRDIVYPYDIKTWIKPFKPDADSTGHGNDTLPAKLRPADTDHDNYITAEELKNASDTTVKDKQHLTAQEIKDLNDFYVGQPKRAATDTSAAASSSKKPKNIIQDIRYSYVVHQIAESYRLNHDYGNATTWYRKSLQATPPAYPDDRYWYGTMLMSREKYDSAAVQFEQYRRELKDTLSVMGRAADKKLLSCAYAGDPSNISTGVIITELDTVINAGTSNFAPSFYGESDELLFTSGRSGNKTPEGEEENARFYSDLYVSKKDGSKWGAPSPLPSPINTGDFEAAGTLSINKDLFLFTRWTGPGTTQPAIYLSKFLNNQWLPPLKLNQNVNAEGYSSMQPYLSFDGTKLYFASDRPGGKGGMDIWMCPLDESGNPGMPVNLGPRINTAGNEVTPFYHDKTTTLYYSSDGLVGFGGLDIYKAYASDEDSLWSTPINMGKPINSSLDDSYFILQRDQRAGYFASDRKVCESCAGGSCYRIYTLEKEPLVFSIKGKVYNSETNEPIAGSLLTFKDINADLQPFYIITDETGAYSSILRQDMEFYIKAQKIHFFADAATISTKGLTESKEFEQDFFLSKIPEGDIVIPGIEYDYNSSNLRPQSKAILDSVVDFLNLNNNISIEISSHTDTRGSDVYNLNLSNERAKSVVDYLISKGIAPGRLIAQGYGETKPLISDAEIAKMKSKPEQEAAHQKNRRTAFRTTKEDAIRAQ
jgi:OOP family OmpA-OmpF porin